MHHQEAKRLGHSITVETCPHYLAFSAEEIKDGDTRFKCAPPIREAENREKLWEALMVFSKFSPAPICFRSGHQFTCYSFLGWRHRHAELRPFANPAGTQAARRW